jgi:hypothetical protein
MSCSSSRYVHGTGPNSVGLSIVVRDPDQGFQTGRILSSATLRAQTHSQHSQQRLFHLGGRRLIQRRCRFCSSALPNTYRRQSAPSRRSNSAPPAANAIASATLCPSPPLSVAHGRIHNVFSTSQSPAIRMASSSVSCEVDLRAEKDWRRETSSSGVPGSREGRWGTYCTRVR